MHPAQPYWEHGRDSVPQMTGAANRLDGSDLVEVCTALGIGLPFTGGVVDVGCGTGRLQVLCHGPYLGLDITRSAVEYCLSRHRAAFQIQGAGDVCAPMPAQWVTAVSLFTHMLISERQAYLERFSGIAPNLLVDIVPGPEGGEVRLAYAAVPSFEALLTATGYRIAAVTDRDWDGILHRFYWAVRA